MVALTIDAKGLSCPIPIMKTKKAIKNLPAGSIYEVLTTDPGSASDIAAYCKATGQELLESDVEDGVYRFRIRKGG
jgi:tRNA 2-thiouridine synthesizing protein A